MGSEAITMILTVMAVLKTAVMMVMAVVTTR